MPEKKQTLLVLHARTGRFLSDPNHPSEKGTLTLYQTDPDVLYFDSIPIKKTGQMTTVELLNQWEKRFGDAPPNAGFVFYHDVHNSFSEISVTLSEPKLDPVNHTLNFQLTAISEPFAYDRIEMNSVTLFIDEVHE
ncbi:MAG: hypothetical protein S4CHLAM81_06750 [Chlamydiales bacterium]|nr:hypothetical protein [Chlamydiales bacterium]MCH9635459.1 hypothetical protein [Chlamydiales bacterium]MCH9703439.1 hypothetical protein [Chlamydiota bacterium]